MPDVTSAEALSGFIGLTVVRARRNAKTPDRAIDSPMANSTPAIKPRAGMATEALGTNRATSHISPANISATIGGGIFSFMCSRVSVPDRRQLVRRPIIGPDQLIRAVMIDEPLGLRIPFEHRAGF